MQIYMLPITAGDSSGGAIEVLLPNNPPTDSYLGKRAEIGDLVLGIVSINQGPGLLWGPGQDFAEAFATTVTESVANPGDPCLIQGVIMRGGSGANITGTILLALMQRGTAVPATITVGPVDLRT